jgi:hypothetical protein
MDVSSNIVAYEHQIDQILQPSAAPVEEYLVNRVIPLIYSS